MAPVLSLKGCAVQEDGLETSQTVSLEEEPRQLKLVPGGNGCSDTPPEAPAEQLVIALLQRPEISFISGRHSRGRWSDTGSGLCLAGAA